MSTSATAAKRLPLPDLADIIFLLVLQLILFLKPDFIFSDGSLGWHLVTGNYILEKHSVPHTDLISYTFPDKPWVAYEWLSDLVMASIMKLGGFNLLAVMVCSSISLLFMLLYMQCRKRGCTYALAVPLVVMGAITSSVHWLSRPHLFTFFGVYIFSIVLNDFWTDTVNKKRLVSLLTATMLIWVNCHPAFLFGFVILLIYAGCALLCFLTSSEDKRASYLNKLRTLSLALIFCLAISLFNPYFFSLYTYIRDYLNTGAVLSVTDEFRSPVFHGELQPLCLELLYGFFLIGLAITRAPLSFPNLVMAVLFIHLSLSSIRNMPLFVIVILPIIAQLYSKTIFSGASPVPDGPTFNAITSKLMEMFRKHETGFTENERLCNMHILPWAAFIALSLVAVGGGKIMGIEILNSTFDKEHKPVKTLDKILALKLNPKEGFNYDNWGGYIKYMINYPVFIDDRADFYGDSFYHEYGAVAQLEPGWQDILKRHHITWILVPRNSHLAIELDQPSKNLGWERIECDNSSSLYVLKDRKNAQ
jgi:hypothetical protein